MAAFESDVRPGPGTLFNRRVVQPPGKVLYVCDFYPRLREGKKCGTLSRTSEIALHNPTPRQRMARPNSTKCIAYFSTPQMRLLPSMVAP